ncbi:hypothetical protein EXE43_14175 [Halorubrum sp. SS5]|nr:hypothetical protein EXE43_14175 [Halorubrum sp. SS5]
MDIFNVGDRAFSSRSQFHQYLTDEYEDVVDQNLYICAGITEHTADEFAEAVEEEGWSVTAEYDHIKLIEHDFGEETAKAYLSFDGETGVFFLYTDQRKNEEIDKVVLKLLRETDGIHYLYIGPRIIRNLCEDVQYEWDASKVTTFIAKRTPGTEIGANRRPDTNRTINYYGDDGMKALSEVERDYGVLPHTVEIKIPTKVRFRVNKEGVFAIKNGDLETLFKYMSSCIKQTLAMKQEYDETDFEILEAGNGYEIPQSKPATIKVSRNLTNSMLRKIRDTISQGGYTLLDGFLDESSNTFTAKVFDSEENLFFNIEVTSDRIRVFPREESAMSVFLRFFEFVQSEIDDQAEPKQNAEAAVAGEV